MEENYTPMDPHVLIERITAEAYCILSMQAENRAEGPEDMGDPEAQTDDAGIYLEGLALIGQAWSLQEETEEVLKGLDDFAQGLSEAPREDTWTPMDEQILTALWGLFDTAVRLEDREERELIRRLAQEVADFHALDLRVQTL